MAERRHGGRRGDARGGNHGGERGDLPNEESARQRDLRTIENDDLRQQVRDLQRDIENGDLRQQVRDLKRRLARLEKRRGKSNPMRSIASERRSMDDPLFSDVFTSYDADEPSQNCNNDILPMPVYDTPVYDEDILLMPVYDTPVYDEDILLMPVYDTLVYDEDIVSMPVYDKPVYDEVEGGNHLLEFMFGNVDGEVEREKDPSEEEDGEEFMKRVKKAKVEKFPIVDHLKIDYPSFRKNFYNEVKQIAKMTYEEVAAHGKQLELKAHGKDVPTPVKAWHHRGLATKFLGTIKKLNYEKPMSIQQAQALPVIMSGRNCIVQSMIYGAEHLLRLFAKLPELLANVERDDGDKVDSRTSLFQEGEYDAVEYMTWWLRKIYFGFYLFPS